MEECYWKLQGVVENEKHTKSTLECTQVTTQQRDHQTYKSSSIVDRGWLHKYIKHNISWEILKTYLVYTHHKLTKLHRVVQILCEIQFS